MTKTLINGKFYSWSSIRFNFLGRSVQGVQAINYDDSDEFKAVRGVGKKKMGFTQENQDANGSIKLVAELVEQLQEAVPSGRIQDIAPFDITVSFKDGKGLLKTHVLKGVKLMKNSREGQSGSTDELSVEIPLFIMDIDWTA